MDSEVPTRGDSDFGMDTTTCNKCQDELRDPAEYSQHGIRKLTHIEMA